MEYEKKETILFYERYSVDELNTIHKHIQKLSSQVSDWRKKYKKYMKENKYPSIKYLQQLLNMTDKFPYTIKEIHNLKNYLKVVNVWVEEANILLLRDKRNVNKENLKPRSLNQIKTLIDKADAYAFESSEIKTLKTLYEAVINFQATVSSFLKNPDMAQATLNDVKELVREGQNLDVDIPEMQQLNLVYENLVWREEIDQVIIDGKIEADYKTVNKLINMAKECNIPSDNKVFQDLCHEKEIADNWKNRAEKLMAQPEIDLKDLENLLDEINDIPNIEGLMEDLHNMRVKAEDYIEMAKMYLDEREEEEEAKNEIADNNNDNKETIKETVASNDLGEVKKEQISEEGKEVEIKNKNEKELLPIKKEDKLIVANESENENSNHIDNATPTVEENDNDLCRHFDNDHEEDEDTLYEDSMDIGKDDYQKIKKNKERIASYNQESSKFDLKYILNNNHSSSQSDEGNDSENILNSQVNSLVYNSICDAVDEIKNEPLLNSPNKMTAEPESDNSNEKIIYKLPERKIDIEQWKEKYSLDKDYNLKELKKSGSKKKNDKKNKKKKSTILTLENFQEFIDMLNSQKVKIDIQQSLNHQLRRIESLFEKGKNFFDLDKNLSFGETLNEILENIKNCIQTLNINDEPSSPITNSDTELNNGKSKNDRSKSGTNNKDLKNKKKNNNHPAKNAYCFCRKISEGFMVACDICNEWYHGQW